ncbi:kappa-type opioid receptor-like [Mytilus californianus]|uniref:kappa-type opioid receptor-like n=1 Tax=Mytilus californianus TaxID=6549 RepID=UPI00224580C0|nr:kappa-type opioid receptor-like [Mytilus californianus]
MISTNHSEEIILFHSLKDINDAEAKQRLPTIIYLAFLVTFGVIGNSLVLFIYGFKYKPSNLRCYVLCLAVLDLTACCISMPSEIVDNAYPHMFYSEGFCKFSRFIGDISKLGSAFVLTVMAVGRYRKICFPFSEDMSLKTAKIMCVVAISVSVLLSWPTAFIQGQTVEHFPGNITGYGCSTDDDFRPTNYPFVQATVLLVTFAIVFCVLIFLYGKIIWELRDHFRMNRLMKLENGLKRKKHTVTKIFLCLTLAYIVSYIPYLTLNAIRTIKRGNVMPPSPIVLGILPILFRSYFINNVVNVIVYYIGDSTFRKVCRRLKQLAAAMFCSRKKIDMELRIDRSTKAVLLG